MKTYTECLAWMEEVAAYRKAAPEGVYMAYKDRMPTLRDVDPIVIMQLYMNFSEAQVPAGVKWQCKLESSETGAFCSLTLEKTGFMGYKLLGCSWRFFYRKHSEQV